MDRITSLLLAALACLLLVLIANPWLAHTVIE